MLALAAAALLQPQPWVPHFEIPSELRLESTDMRIRPRRHTPGMDRDLDPEYVGPRLFEVTGEPACFAGRLLVLRGAWVECWDLDARRMVWELPSEDGFWGLQGVDPVTYVLPGGPADRAGLRRGDRIRRVDGRKLFQTDVGPHPAGRTLSLEVESAGGTRTLRITLEAPPRPFGIVPDGAAFVGGVLVVHDAVRGSVGVDPATGAVRWRAEGGLAASHDGVATFLHGSDLAAVDALTGREVWRRDDLIQPEITALRDGFLLSTASEEGAAYASIEPRSGRVRWVVRCTASKPEGVPVELGDRILLTFAEGIMRGRSLGFEGAVRFHAGPTCLRHFLVDAKTGNLLWSRSAGGRKHPASSNRHGIEYIDFDPDLGGTLKVAGDRLAWFDLDTEEVALIDPATLKEGARIGCGGANRWSRYAPPGIVGVAIGDELLWIDTESGKISASLLIDDPGLRTAITERWRSPLFDGRAAFVFSENAGSSSCLTRLDFDGTALRRRWEVALPASEPEEFAEGDTVLSSGHVLARSRDDRANRDTYRWIDGDSGRVQWLHALSNPRLWKESGGTLIRGAVVKRPFLVIQSMGGLTVFRKGR